jgi:pyruvate dehydrogenase E2 component (dihydrolipoamide acetyltransferase)
MALVGIGVLGVYDVNETVDGARGDRGAILEIVRLAGMRRLIATRMTQSLREMAQLTLHRAIDARALLRLREQWQSDSSPTINDLVLFAVAKVLADHPAINATLNGETVTRWRSINLGIAVAIDDGLMVPVLHGANQRSFADLRAEIARLIQRARERKLAMTDIEGATFTVSNLGGLGIDTFTPIVDPPQVAILGVGRINDDRMALSLTIDHRALDGAEGARFLAGLAEVLEGPGLLSEPECAESSQLTLGGDSGRPCRYTGLPGRAVEGRS